MLDEIRPMSANFGSGSTKVGLVFAEVGAISVSSSRKCHAHLPCTVPILSHDLCGISTELARFTAGCCSDVADVRCGGRPKHLAESGFIGLGPGGTSGAGYVASTCGRGTVRSSGDADSSENKGRPLDDSEGASQVDLCRMPTLGVACGRAHPSFFARTQLHFFILRTTCPSHKRRVPSPIEGEGERSNSSAVLANRLRSKHV